MAELYPRMSWAWAIYAHFVSFLLKVFVKVALRLMTKDDVLMISKHIEVFVGPTDHDSGSEWSIISDSDEEGHLRPKYSSVQVSSCQHVNTTRRGTNGDSAQIKCSDCGTVLYKKMYKKKTASKKPVQRRQGSCGSK